MNPLVPRLLAHAPDAVRRQALVRLFRATSAAFECDMPPVSGLAREACLAAYARFTADCAGQTLRGQSDTHAIEARLYANAYRLGRAAGRLLAVRTVRDTMAAGRMLYGIIDIDLEGDSRGEIVVGRCYFSGYYSPGICRVMSAMDRGLLSGLAGGGDLVFTQRITEGHACCRARFTPLSGPGEIVR